MAKKETKAKGPVADLTTEEIKGITEKLVALRKKLLANGATALNPTAEWTALRHEISLLNKKLNVDAAAKTSRAAAQVG